MSKLVLIRHGESVWNKENLFTGWTDVDLSETSTSSIAITWRSVGVRVPRPVEVSQFHPQRSFRGVSLDR